MTLELFDLIFELKNGELYVPHFVLICFIYYFVFYIKYYKTEKRGNTYVFN